MQARGEKWKELSALLPNVNATITESVAQIDLAAEGFRFATPGIPKIIGPIGIFQAQTNFSQSIFDLHLLDRNRGASANQRSAEFDYKDARELVVLAVGNSYLQTLSVRRSRGYLAGPGADSPGALWKVRGPTERRRDPGH